MKILVAALLIAASAQPMQIEMKHSSAAEQQTKEQLSRLLSQYDAGKFTFTRRIVIDEDAIPHSNPMLTLSTRHLKQDDELLSTYVHEQMHWFLNSRAADTTAAENDLRVIYPKVPFGDRDGARDEESTYLHLIDCYLEEQADIQLMGTSRTKEVMEFWAGDHYRWVYRTVLSDGDKIGAVLTKHKLELEDAEEATKSKDAM